VVVGIILVLTGIPQIMSQPGIFDYISTIAGVLLVIIGLYGFKARKII
jgi:sulfite exporter TauE/SafE